MRYRLKILCFFLPLTVFACTVESPLSDVQQINHTLFEQLISSAEFGILERADFLMDIPPVSITDNPSLQHLHDNRTYVSLACYWWPDPNSDDGLPYIRRDGEVNPETRSNASDLPKLIDMALRVELFTKAFLISGEELYSKRAIDQIHTWFLDPNTAMRPHLEHAQMIKGLNRGRSYGVIDTWWLIRVIDALPVLQQSSFWTDEIERGLKHWFTHYLNWLRNSEFGLQEKQSSNNHGTWYDVQVVVFSLYVNQYDYARHHLQEITKPRFSNQFRFTGRQYREVNRPRPEHYSIYNLSGWLKLAKIAGQFGLTLDNHAGFLAGNLNNAIFYLINMMQDQSVTGLLDHWDRTDTDHLYLNLLMDAWQIYNEPLFKNNAIRTFQEIQSDRIPMLTPKNYIEIKLWYSDHLISEVDS